MSEVKELKVKLDGVLTRVPKLIDYESVPEPGWGDDTGRDNRVGDFSGTFIGYFTNLNLNIGPTTSDEYKTLCRMFERSTGPICTVSYEREDTGELYEEDFYGVALKAKKGRYDGEYKGFQIQLTATKRRTFEEVSS